MNYMRLKKGDRVIDSRDQKGIIITDPDNDPHNVEVDWDGEIGYGTYCIVPGCHFYDPLERWDNEDIGMTQTNRRCNEMKMQVITTTEETQIIELSSEELRDAIVDYLLIPDLHDLDCNIDIVYNDKAKTATVRATKVTVIDQPEVK